MKNESIEELKKLLKEEKSKSNRDEDRIKALEAAIDSLRSNVKLSIGNINDFLERYTKEMNRQSGEVYEAIKFNSDIEVIIQNIINLKRRLEELSQRKNEVDEKLEEFKKTEEKIEKYEGLIQEQSDLENKNIELSRDIVSKQGEIDKSKAEIDRINKEITDLREELNRTPNTSRNRKKRNELKEEIHRSNDLINDEKEKIKSFEIEKKNIEDEKKLNEDRLKEIGKLGNIADKLNKAVDNFNKLGGKEEKKNLENQQTFFVGEIDKANGGLQTMNSSLQGSLNTYSQISDKAAGTLKWIQEGLYAVQDYWRFLKGNYSYWEKTEHAVFVMARTAGMSAKQAEALTSKQLEHTQKLAVAYGTTGESIIKMKESYMQATERASYLTDENVEYMTAMSKLFGEETTNNMIAGLDKVGVSITDTGDIMFMAQQRAKAIGLHAGKSTEAIAKNLDKLNKYNFRNGVDGLTRMVLKTQELKTSMDAVMGITEKFGTIEDSLKNAAGLQMLGGGFASMASNPMGLMYKSLSDPEALFNDVVKAVGGMARLDKKTGQMTLDPVSMMRIKAASEVTGIAADELAKISKQESKRQVIESELSKGNHLSADKDKKAIEEAYIKNKAYYDTETGKHVINLINEKTGQIEKKAITAVTGAEIERNQALEISEENAFKDIRAIREHLTGPISDQLEKQARDTTSSLERKKGLTEEAFPAGIARFFEPFYKMFKWGIGMLGKAVAIAPPMMLAHIGGVLAVGGGLLSRNLMSKWVPNLVKRGGGSFGGVFRNVGNRARGFFGRGSQTPPPIPGGPTGNGPIPSGPQTPPAPPSNIPPVNRATPTVTQTPNSAKPNTRTIKVNKGGGTGLSVKVRQRTLRATPRMEPINPSVGSSGFKFKGGGGKGMLAMAALMIGSQLLSSNQSQEEQPTSNISSANTNVNEGECSICELVKLAIERNELLSALAGVRRTEEKQEEIQEEESVASKAGDTVMTAAYLAGEKTTASVTSKAVSSIAGKTAGKMAGKVAGTVLKGAMKGSLYSMAGDLLNEGLVAGGVIEEGGHINKLLKIGTRAAEWGAYGSAIPIVGSAAGATAGAIYETLNQYRDSDAVNYILGKRTSEEERALLKQQADFETGKIGFTDITDPALMEKAAMATIGIHDLLITKWNREEGKRDDGTEKGVIEEYVDNMSNNFEKIPIVGKPLADASKWVYDKFSNFLGEENGGIIPEKAEKGLLVSKGGSDAIEGMMENTASSVMSSIGAMIPGDSYTGDKVHVMANSGEMILNKAEQKSLFELLKSGGKSGMLGVAGLISSSLFGKKEGGNVKNPISSILGSVGNFMFGDEEGKDSILSKILFAVNKIAGIETPNTSANGVVSDTIKETNESKFNEIIVRKLNNDNISSLYTETVKPSEPIGSTPSNVSQYRETMIYGGGNATVSDINVNISGTIRLEGANGGVGIDFNELMNNSEFRRQIVEMVKERLNTQGTGGKMNKESMSYNTSMMYNRT